MDDTTRGITGGDATVTRYARITGASLTIKKIFHGFFLGGLFLVKHGRGIIIFFFQKGLGVSQII